MRHGLDAKLASVEKLANFASSSRGSFSDPNELEGGSSSSSSSDDPRADLKRHSLELCRLMEAGARDADCPTSADLDLVLHVLDEYYRQVWSFLEFMVVVDFLHRVETDATLLRIVRAANPFTAQELAASALAGGTFGIHASMGRAEGAAAAGAAAAGAAGRGQDDQGGKDEEARDGRDEGGKLRAGGRSRTASVDRAPLEASVAGGSVTGSSGTQSPRSKGSRSRENSKEKPTGPRSNSKGSTASDDVASAKGPSLELADALAKNAEAEATNKQLHAEVAALKAELRSKKSPPARSSSSVNAGRVRGEAPSQRQ
jgi:hypothetical protein